MIIYLKGLTTCLYGIITLVNNWSSLDNYAHMVCGHNLSALLESFEDSRWKGLKNYKGLWMKQVCADAFVMLYLKPLLPIVTCLKRVCLGNRYKTWLFCFYQVTIFVDRKKRNWRLKIASKWVCWKFYFCSYLSALRWEQQLQYEHKIQAVSIFRLIFFSQQKQFNQWLILSATERDHYLKVPLTYDQ